MAMNDFERSRICTAAREYLGVPWRGQGRDRKGVDCTGLIVCAFRDAGYEIEEGVPDYRNLDTARLLRTLLFHCERLPNGAPMLPADVVLYGRQRESHAVILVDGSPLNAIHAPMFGKVVEARFDPSRYTMRGAYRWRL